MSLTAEKETLTKELEALRSNHEQLINDLSELKDSYTELDLSLAKSLHRCEVRIEVNVSDESNKIYTGYCLIEKNG